MQTYTDFGMGIGTREDNSSDVFNEDDNLKQSEDNNQLPNQLQDAGAVSAKEEILSSEDLLGSELDKETVVKEITMEAATEELESPPSSPDHETAANVLWYQGILTRADLNEICPHRANFLKQLEDLIQSKLAIQSNLYLSDRDKQEAIASLRLRTGKNDASGVKLEDLRYVYAYVVILCRTVPLVCP